MSNFVKSGYKWVCVSVCKCVQVCAGVCVCGQLCDNEVANSVVSQVVSAYSLRLYKSGF